LKKTNVFDPPRDKLYFCKFRPLLVDAINDSFPIVKVYLQNKANISLLTMCSNYEEYPTNSNLDCDENYETLK